MAKFVNMVRCSTWVLFILSLVCLAGCSSSQKIAKAANRYLFADSALASAHVGISIYQPKNEKYLYQHDGDKLFVPASNVKIATCFAAMKYLGKSLPGIRYNISGEIVYIQPTGDPTFLHPDFSQHRVYDFLKHIDKKIVVNTSNWHEERWGKGWAWDDYADYYMAERSAMPLYGNVVEISGRLDSLQVRPSYFLPSMVINAEIEDSGYLSAVTRDINFNRFFVSGNGGSNKVFQIPFVTQNNIPTALLSDTLGLVVNNERASYARIKNFATIHSQPTDTLLKIMMHRSDNFFAEQTLLMVSNVLLGEMNDEQIIDSILKSELKYLPQKPRWVDGSGLSRYNLFSPNDFVYILNTMRQQFGRERVEAIFATGNEGTLHNYFVKDSGYIFAKTGTLSGVVALSGYITTKRKKSLVFSVLVNNHHASATAVRLALEAFLQRVIKGF